MVPTRPKYEMTVDELGELAIQWAQSVYDPIDPQLAAVEVKACIDIANIKLATAEQEIRSRQIDLTREANNLTEKLLKSNEEASKQSQENAKSMNRATEQLASSTKWLTIATFVLVFFAAVQAFIALAALLKKP